MKSSLKKCVTGSGAAEKGVVAAIGQTISGHMVNDGYVFSKDEEDGWETGFLALLGIKASSQPKLFGGVCSRIHYDFWSRELEN
ncbi:hypothetical protein LTR65_004744 [Meristemomyces frigidus]